MNIPETFTALPGFVVPDEFWPALGYEGDARFVAVQWTPFGDEALAADGQMLATMNWGAYLALLRYAPNAEARRYPCPHCGGLGADEGNIPCPHCWGLGSLEYNLGDSDREASHWLVVDRETEAAWVAPVQAAERFLRQQWPEAHPHRSNLTTAQFDELTETVRAALQESPRSIGAMVRENHRRLEALRAALRRRADAAFPRGPEAPRD